MAEVVTDSDGFEWVSKRNCALRPGRLAALLAIPAGASLTIAASFASVGAWWILVFSVIELLGLVAAFIVYARHAGAYERLFLTRDRLVVEVNSGTATSRGLNPGRLGSSSPVPDTWRWWGRAGHLSAARAERCVSAGSSPVRSGPRSRCGSGANCGTRCVAAVRNRTNRNRSIGARTRRGRRGRNTATGGSSARHAG